MCQPKEFLPQCRVLERAFGEHLCREHNSGILSIESVLGELALSGKLGIQRWRYCHLTNIKPEHRIETCVMSSVPKSVLIVSQDEKLRTTCAALLKLVVYEVTAVASDNEAMALLETRMFDWC